MKRKVNAVWSGDGANGTGFLSTQSGGINNLPYSFKSSFKNDDGTLGTNHGTWGTKKGTLGTKNGTSGTKIGTLGTRKWNIGNQKMEHWEPRNGTWGANKNIWPKAIVAPGALALRAECPGVRKIM